MDKKTTQKRYFVKNVNLFSLLTYSHMLSIYKNGFKNNILEDNFYEFVDKHKSSVLGNKLELIWQDEYTKNRNPSLWRVLFRMYGFKLILWGAVKLFADVIMVTVMPRTLGRVLLFFDQQTQISISEAYIDAGILSLCFLINPLFMHGTSILTEEISMKIRISSSALVYRKILRLNKAALAEATVGQILNLVSTDIDRFAFRFFLINAVWAVPMHMVVASYMLYEKIGISAFVGIILLMSFVPFHIWVGQKWYKLRKRAATNTDKRIRLMNELINSIQTVKMFCWENLFEQLISEQRRKEMRAICIKNCLLGCVYGITKLFIKLSIFGTIFTYQLLGCLTTPKSLFEIMAIYAILNVTFVTQLSLGISTLADVNVALKRIQTLLLLPEKSNVPVDTVSADSKIVLKHVNAKWLKSSKERTLENINLEIGPRETVILVGAVGSGKSSLFNVILQELSAESGFVNVKGTVSYSAQEAWLLNTSIRQNILFGGEYNEERYHRVLEACALESDIKLLPHGDCTVVGERGKLLSGGQKARISLARCIYKKAHIYLLDDPLSAVDANVARHLYENCVKKFLKNKICLLITHQIRHLNAADRILIMENGKIGFQGTLADLKKRGSDCKTILNQFSADGTEEELIQNQKCEDEDTVSAAVDETFENDPLLSVRQGNNKLQCYLSYIKSGGGACNALLMVLLFVVAYLTASFSDYYIAFWVAKEHHLANETLHNVTNVTFSRENFLYNYAALAVAILVLGAAHGVCFMLFTITAAKTFHRQAFSKLLKATVRFYNNNPSGKILNRFTTDMGVIDDYVYLPMYELFSVSAGTIGIIAITAAVNAWILIPLSVILLICYGVRTFYIQTSRNLMRMQALKKSPIYSHINASAHGLSTIRAFSIQKTFIELFDNYQDKHTSAWFPFSTLNRCFGFWIDTICNTFMVGLIFALLYFKSNFLNSDFGLIITQFIRFGVTLQYAARMWADVENQMVSIERLLEYNNLEEEFDRTASTVISKDWPSQGQIEFINVSLTYSQDGPPVLQNLNFTIKPREKVGIVGRTGAGKSSTVTALFQLYPTKGRIVVDGEDISNIQLSKLRSKISIIPQEPLLFSGTLRKNLDPFDEYSDSMLWNVLDQVELQKSVAESPDGLFSTVSGSGDNFSVGQRQLFCLARALIKNNKILVIDEATANVDSQTDALIQKTIREKFADCTVLTIAHRLNTVMDSDRIMVMDGGNIVEFDHPHKLLQNKDGFFFNLLQATTKNTAVNLKSIA